MHHPRIIAKANRYVNASTEFVPFSSMETLRTTTGPWCMHAGEKCQPITSMDDYAPPVIPPPRVWKAVSRERDPRESGPPLLRDTTNFSLLGDPVFRMYYIVHDVNYFNPGAGGCCANFSQPRSVSRQPGKDITAPSLLRPCNLTRTSEIALVPIHPTQVSPVFRHCVILICFLHRSMFSNNILLEESSRS